MRLNDASIASERYRGEPTADNDGRTQWPVCVVWDDEIQGFGVRIYPPLRGKPSRKDFVVTWRTGLKSRTMAIGTFGVDCTLRQARKVARDALDLARRGQDPIEARQRALGIGTAEDLASRFLFEHTSAAKKKTIPGGEPVPAEAAALEAPVVEQSSVAAEATGPAGASTLSAPLSLDAVPLPVDSAPAVAAAATPTVSSTPPVARPAVTAATVAPDTTESPLRSAATQEASGAAAPSAAGEGKDSAARAPTAAASSPSVESAPPPRRGPTRMRMVSLPEALHREIERRARASGSTFSAYLQSLIESEGEKQQAAARTSSLSMVSEFAIEDGTVPSPVEILARVQSLQQKVEVASVGADSFDDDQDRGDD